MTDISLCYIIFAFNSFFLSFCNFAPYIFSWCGRWWPFTDTGEWSLKLCFLETSWKMTRLTTRTCFHCRARLYPLVITFQVAVLEATTDCVDGFLKYLVAWQLLKQHHLKARRSLTVKSGSAFGECSLIYPVSMTQLLQDCFTVV